MNFSLKHLLKIFNFVFVFLDNNAVHHDTSLVKSCVYSLWTVEEVALTAGASIFTSYYQFLG